MTVPFSRRGVSAVAVLWAIGTIGGFAGAEAEAATPKGLFLTVSGSGDTWIRGVRLNCDDVAHSVHPQAAAACADLTTANGDFDLLPGATAPGCSAADPADPADPGSPVTATASGTWHGHAIDWRRTYPDACALDLVTGPVFRF